MPVMKLRPALPYLLALAVFAALALYQLDLPGLHYDEAREGGLPAMQLVRGQPVDARRDASVEILGRNVPLMVQDYIGALQVFLAVPFLAAFGINVTALRLMPVAASALALVLTGALAQRVYGPRAALPAMLALAVQPSFVFWSRQGIFVTSITGAIGAGLLLCVWLGYRRGRARYWITAAFLAGLGLYAKLLFVWLLGALALAALAWLLAARAWKRLQLRAVWPALRLGAACAGAFSAALVPLAIFNSRTGGTFSALGNNLTHSYYGVNNLDFAHNLSVRLYDLGLLLDGSHLWYLGATLRNPFAPWAYALAALLLLAAAARRAGARALLLLPAALALLSFLPGTAALGPVFSQALQPWCFAAGAAGLVAFLALERDERARLRLAPLAVLGLMVLQSCFTVSDLFVTHYALLAPLAPLVLAAACALPAPAGSGARPRALLLALLPALVLLALLVPADAWSDLGYHRALARTGGLSTHSDAVYRLTDLLRARGGPAVAMDWGMAAQVQFLSAGTLVPVEVFGYEPQPDAGFKARVEPWLSRPDAVFVFHSEQETVFPRREAFEALAGPAMPVDIISRRDGGPVFEIVRVRSPLGR